MRTLLRVLPALLCLLLLALPAVAQMPAPAEGEYDVVGFEPGSQGETPDYTGSVELRTEGEAYVFHGQIDGALFSGVGIYDPEGGVLSIMFEAEGGKSRGVSSFKNQGDNVLDGSWLYLDDTRGVTGHEVWTLRKR